jgi:hypothetical protein
MALVMTVCFYYRCLPLPLVFAWYGVLVAAIGILRGSRGVKYLTSIIYCLLLAATITMIWAPWALGGTIDWSGTLRDPWIVGTNLPFAIAVIACIVMSILRMRSLPRSEWQFTLRDGLVFVSATAVFLGVIIPFVDWSV